MLTQESQLEKGSFRDRNGRIFYYKDAVYRTLSHPALKEWELLSSTKFFKQFSGEGKLIQTEQVNANGLFELEPEGNWAGVLKHQTIPFISYPYEWPFGMLKDAALLQLDLLLAAIDEDITLKDASAFNIQWRGSQPVFIDILSFEKLNSGEPWAGYRQFCQMYLYPLFLQAYKNIPFHPWLRGSIDGISPESCRNMMSVRDLFRKGVLTHVYLHALFQANYSQTKKNIKKDLKSFGFNKELIKINAKKLRGIVQSLTWKQAKSEWSDYADNTSYTDVDHKKKVAFISNVTSSRPWNLVWDLGCNTGTYSRIAAKNAKSVVATDFDPLAVEQLYQSIKSEGNTSILPLTINLADASPNLGWRGKERKTLTERGKPELTLALALIHHIVISANIPLKEFIDWLASLQTSLVIEFVTKEDPMVKTLLRNKEDNYTDYEINYFEKCLNESFNVVKKEILDSGTRILYFAEAIP